MAPPRASLYVRLSKAANEVNVSLEGMTNDLRDLCAKHGFEEVALRVDNGISGAVRDRPEFLAWLADARDGRADVLVTYHADRLTREGLNAAALILDTVEGKDFTTGKVVSPPVRLMDVKGLDSRDGEGFRLRFVVQAEIARGERERMKERARARVARLRTAGRWPGGSPPFGYRVVDAPDGIGKVLAPHPEEAEVLREVVDRVLSGNTLGSISQWLNGLGVSPRRGDSWYRNTLWQMLTGDHLAGRVTISGQVLRDTAGRAVEVHEPLVSPAELAALRDVLQTKSRAKPRGRHPSRLLSTLIECAACGTRLSVHRNGAYIAYRCHKGRNGGNCPAPPIASAPVVEDYVAEHFLLHAGSLPMTIRRVIVPDNDALAVVEDAIAATLTALGTSATPENFARLQALQAEREALAALPTTPAIEMQTLDHSLREEWLARDLDGRRELLRDAFLVIALRPGNPGRRKFDPARLDLIWRAEAAEIDF